MFNTSFATTYYVTPKISKWLLACSSMLIEISKTLDNAWLRPPQRPKLPLFYVWRRGTFHHVVGIVQLITTIVVTGKLWGLPTFDDAVSCTSERTSVPKARPRARSACGRPGVWKIRPANLILSVTIGTQAAAWRLERTALHTRHEFKKSDATWQLLH